MPVYLEITLRAVLTYIVLLLFSRLMGKREISQMTFFDYVTGISIGSIGAQLSTNRTDKWLELLPAVVVFALFQIISSILFIYFLDVSVKKCEVAVKAYRFIFFQTSCSIGESLD